MQARSLASSRCEHAWRAQRQANDWAGFVANFREVLRIAREEAELLSQQQGVSKYEALMDRFEPGMSCAEVDRVFGDLKQWLPGLIRQAQASARLREAVIEPVGPFATLRQVALCERVTRLLGFDFEAGRLDVSTHPFSGGVPEDVRLTTRYREDDFQQSLMGTIHETGHGRYEQNRPRELARAAGVGGALDGDPREPEPRPSRCSSDAAAASSACSRRCSPRNSGRSRRSRPTTCTACSRA